MLVDNTKNKLVNAIIYFIENTKYCRKTKLFKLLYFLDFQHYKEVGRSVTGLNYYAWPKGPVPRKLHNEMDKPNSDILNYIAISHSRHPNGGKMTKITPKAAFSDVFFSKRELRILKNLANEYKTTLTNDMIEATHLENLPWHKVYEEEKNKQGLIPYKYAVNKSELYLVNKVSAEHSEVIDNYK